MNRLVIFGLLLILAFGLTEVMSECFNTRCHAHSEGSWCPENMVTKKWHYCAGVLGKWEECCTR